MMPDQKHMRGLKRLGVAGFAFFLAKGLLWLAVIAIGARGCGA